MKLRIYRKKELANFAGKFDILIDGVKTDTIKSYEDFRDFQISNKNTQIQLQVQWCKSNIIRIENDEKDTNLVVTSKINFYKTTIIVLMMVIFGYLAYNIDKNFIYLMFATYLYPLYYITIGRNQYLRLDFM